MDQAAEDGVGVGGIADQCVPLIDGKLAGHDGGAAAVAILEDLQEVVAGCRLSRRCGRPIQMLVLATMERERSDIIDRFKKASNAAR